MILPKLEKGMVVKCTKSNADWWTEGKEYPVVNLCITSDDGYDYYTSSNYVGMEFDIIYNQVQELLEDIKCSVGCNYRHQEQLAEDLISLGWIKG